MNVKQSRHIAWRLYELIAPLKGWVFFSIVCMVGYNIFTAAPAYYAKDIVDAIAYGDNPELKQYFLVGLGMIIVFAIKGLFFFGHNYSVGHLVQSLIVKLRQQLFDHLVNLSLTFFNRSKTGDLISRFTNDLHVFQNMLQVGVTGPFRYVGLGDGMQAAEELLHQRIAQMLFCKLEPCSIEAVDSLEDSVRGEGGFGSTG